jgi:hypothetical protein
MNLNIVCYDAPTREKLVCTQADDTAFVDETGRQSRPVSLVLRLVGGQSGYFLQITVRFSVPCTGFDEKQPVLDET